MRLSLKLTLAIALGVALLLAVQTYLRIEREVSLFEDDMRRDHRALAHALSLAVEVVAEGRGVDEALAWVEEADRRDPSITIRFREPEGEVRRAGGRRGPRDGRRSLAETVTDVEHGEQGDELVTVVTLPLSDLPGVLELRESLEPSRAYVRTTVIRAAMNALVMLGVCVAIILAFGWFFVGRPMRLVIAKLRRVGAGDFTGAPLPIAQRDELGMLASEIDAMCDRLVDLQGRAESEARARVFALEQLRHADRLSTVGELASGIAHEIGTPLNVISARAKMISRKESSGDEIFEDASVIAEQSERIAGIIRQLLDFARQRPPRKSPQDLVDLVRTTLRLLEPLATKRSVRFDFPEHPPSVLPVDPGQIQQVLTNVVMNAIQAQIDGGQVRVRIEDTETGARVSIEDDGPGMPPEVKARVFEPFFTTKDVGKGTGLGLSVAFGIVLEHGGRIFVDSEVGRGSRFTIDLPREAST